MEYIENSEILDRMYYQRGENFENCICNMISENEKNLNEIIEDKLKEKFNNEEVFEILNNIDLLCNANCKTYYKIGVVDGLKLNKEVKKLSELIDTSK